MLGTIPNISTRARTVKLKVVRRLSSDRVYAESKTFYILGGMLGHAPTRNLLQKYVCNFLAFYTKLPNRK